MYFLAEQTGAAICPVVMRTVMRGGQYPDMMIDIGNVITEPSLLPAALNKQLASLDKAVHESDPEAPVPGFELWFQGQRSFHTRVSWLARLRTLAGKANSGDTLISTSHEKNNYADSNSLNVAPTLTPQDSSQVSSTAATSATRATSAATSDANHSSQHAKIVSTSVNAKSHQPPTGATPAKTMPSLNSEPHATSEPHSTFGPYPDTPQPQLSQPPQTPNQPDQATTAAPADASN